MSDEVSILRPLSFGDLFDEAFSLYKRNFVTFFGIALIPSLLDLAVTLLFVPELVTMSQAQLEALSAQQMLDIIGPVFIPVLITVVVAILANGALIKAVANSYLNKPVSIGSAYRYMLPRFFPYIFTFILVGVLMSLAFLPALLLSVVSPILGLLAMLAWVILLVMFVFWIAFLAEVMIVEDGKYMQAISRSRELAKGNWLKIIGILVIFFILSLVIGFALGMLFGPEGGSILNTAVFQLINVLLLPILITPITLLYFDNRVRNEGFDLELLASEMGDDAGGSSV